MNLFTSDWHFGHDNCVMFTDRKEFVFPEDHDAWLVNLWNSQVKPGDVVYHTGDFCFYKGHEKIMELLDMLNGQIVLLKGNHDRSKDFFKLEKHPRVQKADYLVEKKFPNMNPDQPTTLFHYPITSWRNAHHGAWHLHGHCHGTFKPEFGKILDVGLDNAYNLFGEHRMFTEEDIRNYMATREFRAVDHHGD